MAQARRVVKMAMALALLAAPALAQSQPKSVEGRWAVSERIPILGRLLCTAQSAEPQDRREEGAMPERLVAVGRLLHTAEPMREPFAASRPLS